MDHEQRFIAAVGGLEFASRDLAPVLSRLEDWLARLNRDLDARLLNRAGLCDAGVLARQADAINISVRESAQAWAHEWEGLKPGRRLADAFGDKAILLVFGKFNAGKSAFCNFLAGRFALYGVSTRYFRVDAGDIVEMPEGFKEGATETTAQLQGVVLGGKLVLLDTPGLHSVTPENAALTRRCIDGADGVLWLTSSTSPGQVRELDDLAREALRGKPFLPIVTRSDVIEEDEIDGEITKVLCNKTAENRVDQESDVHARAVDKFNSMGADPVSLKPPVSISTYVARQRGQTAVAMREAGFDRLYAALVDICGPALAYKSRKPAEMLLHHLEENVLHGLQAGLLPRLAGLGAGLASELEQLEQRKAHGIAAMWRRVASELPGILDAHAASGDVRAVCGDVSRSVREAFARQMREALADYELAVDTSAPRIEVDEETGYEPLAIEAGTGGQGGGSVDGASMAAAPMIVAVSHEHLHAALESALRTCLTGLMDDATGQCRGCLERLTLGVENLRETLHSHARGLREIQRALRA